MRDINPQGDLIVAGNLTINEAPSQEFVPFEQMSLEDLKYYLNHHTELAKEERNRISLISLRLFGIALVAAIGIAIWYFIKGEAEVAMFIVALVSVGMPVLIAINTGERKSEFEIRQLNTVRHLSHLIRERTPR